MSLSLIYWADTSKHNVKLTFFWGVFFFHCLQELCAHVTSINSEEKVIIVGFENFEEIWKFCTYYRVGMCRSQLNSSFVWFFNTFSRQTNKTEKHILCWLRNVIYIHFSRFCGSLSGTFAAWRPTVAWIFRRGHCHWRVYSRGNTKPCLYRPPHARRYEKVLGIHCNCERL